MKVPPPTPKNLLTKNRIWCCLRCFCVKLQNDCILYSLNPSIESIVSHVFIYSFKGRLYLPPMDPDCTSECISAWYSDNWWEFPCSLTQLPWLYFSVPSDMASLFQIAMNPPSFHILQGTVIKILRHECMTLGSICQCIWMFSAYFNFIC